jgi:putative exporter of polyketide antibiotics
MPCTSPFGCMHILSMFVADTHINLVIRLNDVEKQKEIASLTVVALVVNQTSTLWVLYVDIEHKRKHLSKSFLATIVTMVATYHVHTDFIQDRGGNYHAATRRAPYHDGCSNPFRYSGRFR